MGSNADFRKNESLKIETMAKLRYLLIFLVNWLSVTGCSGSESNRVHSNDNRQASEIITGADQTEVYTRLLSGKKVGVIANQTSLTNGEHLVDVLLANKVNVVRVFAPEHGFRGEAGPGDKVLSGKDPRTGLPVVSLYGSKKRPDPVDVNDLDIVLFDIQDVGARFYTYISTLHYVMEVCAEQGVEVMVLDRPNPNGFYIDGPVLKPEFSSFVGVAPIPVVHGLTVGEYAKMVNGEGWLRGKVKCKLSIVEMKNYNHGKRYNLPVRPSPNLPDSESIYFYPSLCFFEGAKVSVGRGTPYPFKVYGFPGYSGGDLKITPADISGVITDPPYEGKECNVVDLRGDSELILKDPRLRIEWVIEMYNSFPDKESFFNNFFDKLAGTDQLRKDIISGKSADEIRKSWTAELDAYKLIRKKYLIYQ